MNFTPHPYQCRAEQFILANPYCALWLDMGLGKTVITLRALMALIAMGELRRVLIIAPKRVVETTWPEERLKWAGLSRLSMEIILGKQADRLAACETRADLHVINRENVPWLVKYFGKRWPYDGVVIDEASSFKNPSAKRVRALRAVRKRLKRIVQLTGSPAPNGLMDLWAQFAILDGGERLGSSVTRFRDQYFTKSYNGFSWDLRPGAEDLIHAKIQDLVLAMQAQDYLELPPLMTNAVPVAMGAQAEALYRELTREWYLELGGKWITAANAGVLTGKCLQIANGALYDENHAWAEVHGAKLDALEELLDGIDGGVVVAYQFQSDRWRLRQRFPKAVEYEGPETVAAWNAGQVRLLLMQPQSSAFGINLQAGGNHVIWFGLNWSLDLHQQFNARLHRQGQTKPVFVHYLVAEGTVDEAVMEALSGKQRTQQALLDAVKAQWSALPA